MMEQWSNLSEAVILFLSPCRLRWGGGYEAVIFIGEGKEEQA